MTRPHPLARYAHSWRDPDPDGAENAARALWQERGIIVIHPDDNLPGLARVAVEGIATAKYGKRRK